MREDCLRAFGHFKPGLVGNVVGGLANDPGVEPCGLAGVGEGRGTKEQFFKLRFFGCGGDVSDKGRKLFDGVGFDGFI